jgi:hypothetical protein
MRICCGNRTRAVAPLATIHAGMCEPGFLVNGLVSSAVNRSGILISHQ